MNIFPILSPIRRRRAFNAFYAAYAPALWGLILTTDLPPAESEAILIRTLTQAWQQLADPALLKTCSLRWLLRIAYAEGLPTETLHKVFPSDRNPVSGRSF